MPLLLVLLALLPIVVVGSCLVIGGVIIHMAIQHLIGPVAKPALPGAQVGEVRPRLGMVDRIGAWTALLAGLLLPYAALHCAAHVLMAAIDWPLTPFDP